MTIETTLLWVTYLGVVCLVLSLYELGMLIGSRLFGGTCTGCDCGFGPPLVDGMVGSMHLRLRILPFPIGFTIAMRETATGHLVIRRPLIVQLRRQYGLQNGTDHHISPPQPVTHGTLVPILGMALLVLMLCASLSVVAPWLIVVLSAAMGPMTCCAASTVLAWCSMLSGASVIVAIYNLAPVRRLNDGALLLELIRTPRLAHLLAPHSRPT